MLRAPDQVEGLAPRGPLGEEVGEGMPRSIDDWMSDLGQSNDNFFSKLFSWSGLGIVLPGSLAAGRCIAIVASGGPERRRAAKVEVRFYGD